MIYEGFPHLFSYIISLDLYALGDLEVFEENCKKADDYELSLQRASTTTTEQTTVLDFTSPPHQEGSYSAIAPDALSNPRVAIPFAMMLFSLITLLGILYTLRTDPGSTTINMNTFLNKLSPSLRLTSTKVNKLIKICRHGLVHQYFPKANSTSYRSAHPNSIFFIEENGRACLNVKYLNDIFLDGYGNIKKDEGNFETIERTIQRLG